MENLPLVGCNDFIQMIMKCLLQVRFHVLSLKKAFNGVPEKIYERVKHNRSTTFAYFALKEALETAKLNNEQIRQAGLFWCESV